MLLLIGLRPDVRRRSFADGFLTVCITLWLSDGPPMVSGGCGQLLRPSTAFILCLVGIVIMHGGCVARRETLWRLLPGVLPCGMPLGDPCLCLRWFVRWSHPRWVPMCLAWGCPGPPPLRRRRWELRTLRLGLAGASV